MNSSVTLVLFGGFAAVLCATPVKAEGITRSHSRFYYKSATGEVVGARIVRSYYGKTSGETLARIDPRIDPKLRRAATIADERSSARTKARCWRYVKEALFRSGAVTSYPTTNYACQAGNELVSKFGFKKLPIRDPYAAPVGAVIVYRRGSESAGHVELRTKTGFASDYHSKNRCFYPVLAIYGKFAS